VYHSTLGLRVIKKKEEENTCSAVWGLGFGVWVWGLGFIEDEMYWILIWFMV